MQLGPVGGWESHLGQHVRFGLVHQVRQFLHPWAELVSDLAPLGAGGLGIVLGEGGADEGRDDAAALLAGMGQHVAHEMDAIALPSGAQHLGDGSLDALVGVGDHQLDATQAPTRQLAQEGVGGFPKRAVEIVAGDLIDSPELARLMETLIATREYIYRRILTLDREVMKQAKASEVCRRFMAMPGSAPCEKGDWGTPRY